MTRDIVVEAFTEAGEGNFRYPGLRAAIMGTGGGGGGSALFGFI
jgi:hypothetical protein